jgi:hypothetical protein
MKSGSVKWLRVVTLGAVAALLAALSFAPAARADASWSFEPPSWDFGTLVPGNGASSPKVFTLTNTGDAELSAVFVSVAGSEGAGFELAGHTCGKLAPSASCEISITFNPSTPGPKDGQLQISSQGALAPPASAELSGTGAGPEVSLVPDSLAFGSLPLGDVSAPQTFTVTNTGSLDLTISWLSIVIYVHGDTDQFQLTGGTCAAKLVVPPGGSCTVETRFAPTRPGPLLADLLIASDAPGSPDRVELAGVGVAPEVRSLVPPFIEPSVAVLHRPAQRTTKRHAVFWLRGSSSAALFVCKLDREEWFRRCESPVRYSRLRPGRHRFAVRAYDPQGRPGAVSVFRWRIEQDRRTRRSL